MGKLIKEDIIKNTEVRKIIEDTIKLFMSCQINFNIDAKFSHTELDFMYMIIYILQQKNKT